MDQQDLHIPRQSRSKQTLERILSSGTILIAEQSYDEVTVAEIAARAQISVGGFYSRFRNKEALFNKLKERLGQETQGKMAAALARDWSSSSLHDLLLHVVTGNAELYEKYRGVLTVIHLGTRVLHPDGDDSARQAYNDSVMVYNTSCEKFPSNIIAGMFNFRRAELFEIQDESHREAPKVSFS